MHLYSIEIMWRHYKQPDITCITADSAAANRLHSLINNNHAPSPATATGAPHVIHVQGRGWRGRRRETVTWYQPPRDTKTAGAVLGLGHQQQMTPHPSTSRKW